jgi:lysophospholipase L1-like esterase
LFESAGLVIELTQIIVKLTGQIRSSVLFSADGLTGEDSAQVDFLKQMRLQVVTVALSSNDSRSPAGPDPDAPRPVELGRSLSFRRAATATRALFAAAPALPADAASLVASGQC